MEDTTEHENSLLKVHDAYFRVKSKLGFTDVGFIMRL